MTDGKLVPDMSTPEGIEQAFEHVRTYGGEDPQGVTRAVTLEVLRILEEADVEDAASLEEELKGTKAGSGEALYGSIREVGDAYTDEQAAAGSDQHIDLKRTAGIAYTVSSIVDATVAGAAGNGDQGKAWLEGALERLQGIGDSEEAKNAREVLGDIIDDMVEVLPVSESE